MCPYPGFKKPNFAHRRRKWIVWHVYALCLFLTAADYLNMRGLGQTISAKQQHRECLSFGARQILCFVFLTVR